MNEKLFWTFLSCLTIIWLSLDFSIWSLGIESLVILRFILSHQSKRLCYLLVLQLITAGLIQLSLFIQRPTLSENERFFSFEAIPMDFQIDEGILKGEVTLLHQDKKEKVALFYDLKTEEEKNFFQTRTKSWKFEAYGKLQEVDRSGIYHSFDYPLYLKEHGLHHVFKAKQLVPKSSKDTLRSWLVDKREKSLRRLQSSKVQSYIRALFFSQIDHMEADRLLLYQNLGLIHLFSVSGFHLFFISEAIKKIFYRLGITVESTRKFLLVFLFMYGLLLSWPYGLIRAFSHYLIENRKRPLFSLVFSALGILMIQPYALFSLSFQLTYALGFVLFLFSQKPIGKNFLTQAIALNFFCVLITFPFLSYTYHRFSFLPLFLSELFSWAFSTLLFPLMGGLLLISPFPLKFLNGFIELLIQQLIVWIEQASAYFEQLTFLNWEGLGTPNIWYLIFLFFLILMLLSAFQWKEKRKSLSALFLMSLSLLFIFPYVNPIQERIEIKNPQVHALLEKESFNQNTTLVITQTRKEENSKQNKTQSLLQTLQAEGLTHLDLLALPKKEKKIKQELSQTIKIKKIIWIKPTQALGFHEEDEGNHYLWTLGKLKLTFSPKHDNWKLLR